MSSSEFAFELDLCAHLEERRDGIVARQLGGGVADPGGRVLDVVRVEPGPAFEDRIAITSEAIPDAAIAAAVGPGRARFWKDAVADANVHPDRARRLVDRACEIGFFERERRGGRDYVRQVARYPDWFDRIVAIENKPDLDRPGDLEAQLRTDVSLGLVDEVWLATESYVTGAHLHRIPDAVGVRRVDRSAGALEVEVVREATPLPVDEPGIERLEERPGRTDVTVASAAAKARVRRRLAERAYGKGWRTYEVPPCGTCDPDGAARTDASLPHCAWKGRAVDAATECGRDCEGYQPADPPATGAALEVERERRTPWIAEPSGKRRRQTGLDGFT